MRSLGGGLCSFRTSPVTGEPFPRSSSSFIRTRWLHLIDFFFFFVFVAAPLKAVAAPAAPPNGAAASLRAPAAPAAPLKAAAIDVRCHSCTALDVDAPATGGLLVPRTNTLLPPRFFAPTNQFAGRWHGNACGGLPPRRALLRSRSHSFAASQSNAPAIKGGEIKVPRRWRRRREARAAQTGSGIPQNRDRATGSARSGRRFALGPGARCAGATPRCPSSLISSG